MANKYYLYGSYLDCGKFLSMVPKMYESGKIIEVQRTDDAEWELAVVLGCGADKLTARSQANFYLKSIGELENFEDPEELELGATQDF